MKLQRDVALPAVGLTGFEPPLAEEERAMQDGVHRFAKNVLRPLGRELDAMTAEQVIAPGSPYYSVFAEAARLGLDSSVLSELPPEVAVRVESLIGEEMGWGDVGLAISLFAAAIPLEMAKVINNQELMDLCSGKIGCWMITTPDKGGDAQIFDMEREWAVKGGQGNKGNVWAKVGKDEIVINGQSSAWVSNGVIAQVGLCYMTADYGDGFYEAGGRPHGLAVVVPFDLPGISKGKPLDKVGQRSLPQGEIYLDKVKVPKRFATALRDEYYGNLASAWAYAGCHMGQTLTGLARAAFEMALQYCHERKQGGTHLINHQLTRWRLGDMYRRVEACRAVARRSLAYARLTPAGHPYATAASKVTVTEEAITVATEAMRLFGGNGTSREFPIEKLVRDARSALIEDGENYALTMRFGLLLQQLYADGWSHS
jgi:acyl-CoA dehydrogenase